MHVTHFGKVASSVNPTVLVYTAVIVTCDLHSQRWHDNSTSPGLPDLAEKVDYQLVYDRTLRPLARVF